MTKSANKSKALVPEFTKGEWQIGEDGDIFSDGCCIAQVCGAPDGIKEAKANAKRIVNCVNTCAGIDNPAEVIEGLKQALSALVNTIEPPLPKKIGRKGRNDYNIQLESFFVEPMKKARMALKAAGVEL